MNSRLNLKIDDNTYKLIPKKHHKDKLFFQQFEKRNNVIIANTHILISVEESFTDQTKRQREKIVSLDCPGYETVKFPSTKTSLIMPLLIDFIDSIHNCKYN